MSLIGAEFAFNQEFRAAVAQRIRSKGHKNTYSWLIEAQAHPAVAAALIRNVMRREGW